MNSQTVPVMPFGQRIWIYLQEMYPPHINIPVSFLGFYGYYFLLQLLVGQPSLAITLHSVMGAVVLSAFSLQMRVFDEFKDIETDNALFPNRPVPSGRVKLSDVKALGWMMVSLMFLLNLRPGYGLLFFLVLFVYLLLTFKYFFLPELHLKSLPFNLLTHNPITAVSYLYVLGVFLDDFHLALHDVPAIAWLGIPMFWMIVFCWETSRKIRVPEEETAYATYSKCFGPRGAALLPMAGLTLSFALVQWFAFTLSWSWLLRMVLGLAFLYSMGGFVRWLWKQTPEHSKLRPFVEAYSLVLFVALMVEFGVRYGFHWFG